MVHVLLFTIFPSVLVDAGGYSQKWAQGVRIMPVQLLHGLPGWEVGRALGKGARNGPLFPV